METVDNDYELIYMYHGQEDIVLSMIIRKYNEMILKILHKKGINDSSPYIDEIYVNIIGKLPNIIDSFRMDKKIKFKTYLNRCITNEINDFFRKHKAQISKLIYIDKYDFNDELIYRIENKPYYFYEDELSPQERLDGMIDHYDLHVSDCDKTILYLRQMGYTLKEISEITQMSIYRVRKQIKNVIKEMEDKDRID